MHHEASLKRAVQLRVPAITVDHRGLAEGGASILCAWVGGGYQGFSLRVLHFWRVRGNWTRIGVQASTSKYNFLGAVAGLRQSARRLPAGRCDWVSAPPPATKLTASVRLAAIFAASDSLLIRSEGSAR